MQVNLRSRGTTLERKHVQHWNENMCIGTKTCARCVDNKMLRKCEKFASTVSKTVLNCNFSCVGDSNCYLSSSFKAFTMIEGEFVYMGSKCCKNTHVILLR